MRSGRRPSISSELRCTQQGWRSLNKTAFDEIGFSQHARFAGLGGRSRGDTRFCLPQCRELERLLVDCKKSNFSFTVRACLQIATAIIESFNTVPWAHDSPEYSDISAMMDNEALYDDRRRNLGAKRTVHQFEPLARADHLSSTAFLCFVGAHFAYRVLPSRWH